MPRAAKDLAHLDPPQLSGTSPSSFSLPLQNVRQSGLSIVNLMFNFGRSPGRRTPGDVDEYDIDLVCELQRHSQFSIKPDELKDVVGNRLKESKKYESMIEPLNRCWRLNYADDAKFHLDIIPSVPDLMGSRTPNASRSFGPILIPDRKLSDWSNSNPTGYAEWFKSRMQKQFAAAREILAKSLREHIENVPDYRVRTPLQRAVQLLKRHRDIHFQQTPSLKPSSIVITTLAARVYNGEPSVVQSIQSIVRDMPLFVEDRNGLAWVSNPVNDKDNFVDCWEEKPELKDQFFGWVDVARTDFASAVQQEDVSLMTKSFATTLGEGVVLAAAAKVFGNVKNGDTITKISKPNIIISEPITKPFGFYDSRH